MSIGGTDEPRQLGSKTKTCQENAGTRLDERLEHQLGLGCASAPLGVDQHQPESPPPLIPKIRLRGLSLTHAFADSIHQASRRDKRIPAFNASLLYFCNPRQT